MNPSVCVDDNGEGRVWIKCRSGGCSYEEVLAALGLSKGDVFDNRRNVVYRYPDDREVTRSVDKKFHQTKGSMIGAALYQSERVAEAVRTGQRIFVVEGEKDVHAVQSAGGVATCNRGGAEKFEQADYGVLRGASEVVIVRDADEAGTRHAEQVVKCVNGIVARWRVVEAMEGNDSFDHLQAGHGLDDFVPVEVKPPPDLLAGMRNGEWLYRQVFPPLEWIVPGILPEGASILVGGPKIGKSWLADAIALAVAGGTKVLGGVATKRPVLLLALEDGDRRMQSRCLQLNDYQRLPDWFYYQTRVEPGMIFATIETWLARMPSGYPPPLVIVDTLGKAMPPAAPGESDYLRDYRVGGRVKQIADDVPGMGITVLHHDRKASAEDFVHSVSGTNGIAGSMDTILVLKRKRLALNGLLQITGRDVQEAEYAVTSDGGRWSLDGATLQEAAQNARTTAREGALGERAKEILAFVESDAKDGATPKKVADWCGIDNRTASVYLGRLADAGRLTKVHRGLYTPVKTVDSVDSVGSVTTQETDTTPSAGQNGGAAS